MARLTCDHLLRRARGAKRCTQWSASNDCFWPSIQPKQIATSSASAWVTDSMPLPLRAIFSQMPSLPSGWPASHSRQACLLGNESVGWGFSATRAR